MVRGCKLFKDDKNLGTNCPNDHTHCHWCREEGHIALRCPKAGGYRFEPEKEITSCLFVPPPALSKDIKDKVLFESPTTKAEIEVSY